MRLETGSGQTGLSGVLILSLLEVELQKKTEHLEWESRVRGAASRRVSSFVKL